MTDREQLAELISSMDIPECNRDMSVHRNILWLNRNMFIRNEDHPNFLAARDLSKKITREEIRSSKAQ
jgi:hypothetical protein